MVYNWYHTGDNKSFSVTAVNGIVIQLLESNVQKSFIDQLWYKLY